MEHRRLISGIAGVILAGGASRRMGSNKALLPYRGGRFIEAIHRLLADIFAEVILVTNTPEAYHFLPCRKVPDIFPGQGALAGLHAGLAACTEPAMFAVACDMPYLNAPLIRHLAGRSADADIVIPSGEWGMEPLHACYRKSCLPVMAETIASGERRIAAIFPRLEVCPVSPAEIARFDPEFDSFRNINTPDDYFRLRDLEREERISALLCAKSP